MGLEIERKFLVAGQSWRSGNEGTLFRQGYLSTETDRTVRVRIEGEKASLNIKGPSKGPVRREYEYSIPIEEALEILEHLCRKPIIEKTRYSVIFGGKTWEVDEFEGVNLGLTLAEVELLEIDERIPLPAWAGREVTDDPRFFNANLVLRPYSSWPKKET